MCALRSGIAICLSVFFWATDSRAQDDGAIETARLHQLFREAGLQAIEERPETGTFLGKTEFNDRWSDLSEESFLRLHKSRQLRQEALRKIDRAKLSPADRLNYDLFADDLQQQIEVEKYPERLLAVDPLFKGPNVTVLAVLGLMPARNVRDYENFLARLRAVPKLVDQTIALLERGVAAGITHPAPVMRDVPAQMERLIAVKPEDSPLIEAFRRFPASVPETEQKRLAREAARLMDADVFPSFRRLRDYLVKTYIPNCRTTIGRGDLPNGKEWYNFNARTHTTTTLTAQEIHDLGVAEVKRIRAEMDDVIKKTKFQGSFAAFIEFLRTDKRFYFQTAEELLTAYRDICKRIDPELPRLFGKLPRAPYGVRAVATHRAPSETTARYQRGATDGSRPGYFLANTFKLETRPKFEMEALSLHEAVPGHHLQIALSFELEGVPDFRKTLRVNAFSEGWGLYAESLGEELGFYRDPYSKFGQLSYEMWRACRLVVDTGMHVLGWSRQQAIDFMKENTSLTEQNIVVEVDRYIAWPGQALAYKVGELRIKELRREAERELGQKFDIREFHDVVLRNGAIPLDVLSNEVRAWIAAQKRQ